VVAVLVELYQVALVALAVAVLATLSVAAIAVKEQMELLTQAAVVVVEIASQQ
jgi:hypothetical protein